jgi:hypothetical protein
VGIVAALVGAAVLFPKTSVPAVAIQIGDPDSPVDTTIRDARWREDLAYLARELPRLHVNAFHSVDQVTFEEAVQQLDAAIPSLSDADIVTRLMALVALVGDGHTRLDVQPLYGGPDGWQVYGLGLEWLEDGWFVVGAVPEAASEIGARVVAIEDVPMEEIFASLTPLIAADNEADRLVQARGLMVTPQVLTAVGVLANPGEAEFSLIRPDNTTVTRRLSPIDPVAEYSRYLDLSHTYPAAAQQLARQKPDQLYWFSYLPEHRAIYFQYDVCGEMEDKPFADFTEALFAVVDKKPVDRIVIDLRDNGGGHSAVIWPFLDALAERPHLAVYTLVGRNTVSSAVINAIQLDREHGAVLVGEPTGGRPNLYGEVRHFALPNVGLEVSYATKYFHLVEDADPPALEPEIATPLTLTDQIAGRDAALEAALAADTP